MSIMTDEFKVRVTTALIQSNEVYKGEFKTVAELNKISAYEGDYANVFETNTRWQYTNGVWVNTGAALPENPVYAMKDYVNRTNKVLADAIDQEVAARQQAENALSEETATKLTRVESTADKQRAYTVQENGEQAMLGIDTNATENTLVQRNANGQINTADPTQDSNVATKKYVDDAVSVLTQEQVDSLF